MKRVLALCTSLRTAAVLLILLAVLLLLGVLLPQERVVGDERFQELVSGGRWQAFLLADLGLGDLGTSPLFLAVLVLLMVCLLSVLIDRLGVTLRRCRLRPPDEETVLRRCRAAEALHRSLPDGWLPATAMATLQGLGYAVVQVGDQALWGVKHRFAVLGFPLFHLSFILLCAGGLLLTLTRTEITVSLTEGQQLDPTTGTLVRQAAWGARWPEQLPRLQLEQVEAGFVRGEPILLAATLLTAAGRQRVAVNRPLDLGDGDLLIERAGVAVVLWLQDHQGYTVDRVAVPLPVQRGMLTTIELPRALTVEVETPDLVEAFKSRAALQRLPVGLRVLRDGKVLAEDRLMIGQGSAAAELRLVLAELRYWAGLRLVHERGGALLVAGFLLGVIGLVWRLLWQRREVMVVWQDGMMLVNGRSELYRNADELQVIAELLVAEQNPAVGTGGGER